MLKKKICNSLTRWGNVKAINILNISVFVLNPYKMNFIALEERYHSVFNCSLTVYPPTHTAHQRLTQICLPDPILVILILDVIIFEITDTHTLSLSIHSRPTRSKLVCDSSAVPSIFASVSINLQKKNLFLLFTTLSKCFLLVKP